jgi:beta-lactam-binding protein with PASTA domain
MRPEDDEEVPPSGEREDDTAELTVVDEEWPVPPEYRDAAQPLAQTERAPVTPPPGRPPPAAPRRLPPTVAPGLLGLALLLIVGGVVLAFAFRGYPAAGERAQGDEPSSVPTTTTSTQATETETTTATPTVSIPDVSGIPVAEARERLAERGLEARVREVEVEQPEGEVVRQTPGPGREVPRDTAVVLVVSSGPPRVEVPDVIGLSRGRAEAQLRETGLDVELRTRSATEPAGTVLELDPDAGSRVEPESTVRVVVAVEPEPVLVRVARVVGLPVAQARARLREQGLRSTVTRIQSSRPAGTVVRQSPRAGTSAREGEVVGLEVASGPALVAVPDVVGLDEASAREELEAAGFVVAVLEEETSDPGADGTVLAQSPRGGSRVEKGANVSITVAVIV